MNELKILSDLFEKDQTYTLKDNCLQVGLLHFWASSYNLFFKFICNIFSTYLHYLQDFDVQETNKIFFENAKKCYLFSAEI